MPGRRVLIALGSAFFFVVLVRTAWLSELSYLTFRTIEHAATGHGLRWNVSERVQVFDHPLWMLLLLAGRLLTGESYYTTFAISLVLSFATVVLVLRRTSSGEGIVFAAALLVLSRAFISYSTSGLESPLAHLLVVLFCAASLPVDPARLAAAARVDRRRTLLAGLAALTHPLTLIVTVPVLAYSTPRGPGGAGTGPGGSGAATPLAFALGPLLAWMAFAAFYYGTPLPNPTIAEWMDHAGIGARLEATARLFTYVLRRDPLTLAVIAFACARAWHGGTRERLLAMGACAYAILLPLWAGDAMPGRWFALPYLVSVILLVERPLMQRRVALAAAVGLAALALVPSLGTLQSDVRFGSAEPSDIIDARAVDYPATGLLHDIRQWYPPHHPEATRGGKAWQDTNRVKTSPHPGFFGFSAGYGVHVIDVTGRTDPLLARLRPRGAAAFPAGSTRAIPDGYEASLPDRGNAISDPALSAYYDRVRLVTRGPLLDPRRVLAAIRLGFEHSPEPQPPHVSIARRTSAGAEVAPLRLRHAP